MSHLPKRARARKPAPPVRAEWVSRLGAEGRGIILLGRGERLDPYLIEEITGPVGEHTELLGYRFRKPDGTTHDVDLTGGDPVCDCPGSTRWQKPCKHVEALELLVLPEPEAERWGLCFPDDVDVSDPETPF